MELSPDYYEMFISESANGLGMQAQSKDHCWVTLNFPSDSTQVAFLLVVYYAVFMEMLPERSQIWRAGRSAIVRQYLRGNTLMHCHMDGRSMHGEELTKGFSCKNLLHKLLIQRHFPECLEFRYVCTVDAFSCLNFS
eukprot:Gb_24802 [translate_table: standard]